MSTPLRKAAAEAAIATEMLADAGDEQTPTARTVMNVQFAIGHALLAIHHDLQVLISRL